MILFLNNSKINVEIICKYVYIQFKAEEKTVQEQLEYLKCYYYEGVRID